MNQAPVGIFDSGLGGLTVAGAIFHHLPHDSTIYFGDTARVPYGPKSPDTVRRRHGCRARHDRSANERRGGMGETHQAGLQSSSS